MTSPFDLAAFESVAVDLTKQEMDWHAIPDKTECLAQVSKITFNNMADVIAKAPEKWSSPHLVEMVIMWELRDDNLRAEMNMDKVLCRQRLLLEFTAAPPPEGNGVLNWAVNVNQGLKELIKAVGLGEAKKFTPLMINGQLGWVIIKNRAIEGSDREMSEVAFVRDPVAGRRSWEARQQGKAA